MTQQEIRKILEIGVMLSAERDPDRLLDKILAAVMEIAHCDAGTLYLLDRAEEKEGQRAEGLMPGELPRDGDALRFKIMRNHTMGTYEGGGGTDPDMPPVPLRRENVCAYALLERKTVRIADVYESEEYDFSGPRNYDRITGYRTRSMLTVPMVDRSGEGIGVLQLINALDESGGVCAFGEDMALVLESVASQAAVTVQNVRYMRDIRALLDSVVQMMSSAIDERTPYNASHTRHMAECGGAFLDFLNRKSAEETGAPRFTDPEKDEILMSVWLHDVGKLVTPLEVMNKSARLLPEQYARFQHRMREFWLLGRVALAEKKLTRAGFEELEKEIGAAVRLVESVNTAGFLPDEKLAQLAELAGREYEDVDGNRRPWLDPEEYAMLSIRKGTLSEKERLIMEEHVCVTDRLLSRIRFSPEFSHVRQWAASHHELLDGSGYPAHLRGDEIPCQVRIITILDIFDALVADDRPYKPGMPVEKAAAILTSMAEKEGKLDPELTRLFLESRCWEKAEYRFLDKKPASA